MIDSKTYVRPDEHGVLRIGKTRISLDSVVYAFQQGHAAETIQQQFSVLDLEEVYGAIAFYLANKEDVDRYLKGQEKVWDELRQQAEQNASPVVKRLRSSRAASIPEKR